jgi:phosphotriesterase-related protein
MTSPKTSDGRVQTARGPIEAAGLGETLMHEHIFVLDREIDSNYPGVWNEEERIADAVQKLNDAAARGVGTIVDLTVLGLGRHVPLVARVAEMVEVNIVVATGLYTYSDVPMFFKFRGPGLLMGGPDLLTEFFIRDLTEGIAETGVKAGMLKCATDKPGVTPGVERVLRAVARAHVHTGAPISTHTDAATHRGLEQQSIFREEGVDLTRVVIGHCGDSTDLDYLRAIMDAGSFIGMDRFGLDLLLPFEERVATVAELCAQGYAEKMVLSHDASCFTHNFDIDKKQELLPNWVFTHLHDDVLPALRERGVTDLQIDQMLVQNPRAILA